MPRYLSIRIPKIHTPNPKTRTLGPISAACQSPTPYDDNPRGVRAIHTIRHVTDARVAGIEGGDERLGTPPRRRLTRNPKIHEEEAKERNLMGLTESRRSIGVYGREGHLIPLEPNLSATKQNKKQQNKKQQSTGILSTSVDETPHEDCARDSLTLPFYVDGLIDRFVGFVAMQFSPLHGSRVEESLSAVPSPLCAVPRPLRYVCCWIVMISLLRIIVWPLCRTVWAERVRCGRALSSLAPCG